MSTQSIQNTSIKSTVLSNRVTKRAINCDSYALTNIYAARVQWRTPTTTKGKSKQQKAREHRPRPKSATRIKLHFGVQLNSGGLQNWQNVEFALGLEMNSPTNVFACFEYFKGSMRLKRHCAYALHASCAQLRHCRR